MASVSDGTDQSRLVVITGPGGVGKTALALHWLHKIKDDYEGQLFVDLRGFSGTEPLPPQEPLERFLRALGTSAESLPADLDEQAALLRSLTTGRRLIILLDNAVSAAQVRPLLPGGGGSLIVVTTRLRLSGLLVDGARFLDVSPLSLRGALDLLKSLIGADRIDAESDHARTLVALCGMLPLAVCASGARLAARRRWPIARAVAELGDEARRLSTLRTEEGDMSVNVVFNASYQALDDDHARAYRLLGTHPGEDFTVAPAAALLGVEEGQAAELLNGLTDASLLIEEPAERYRFHDLVRLHAREKAAELAPNSGQGRAFARLADWYLRASVAADLVLLPGRWHLGDRYDAPDLPDLFPDRPAALDWLEREQANLSAVAQEAHRSGMHAVTWQLCEAMWPLFLKRKPYRLWLRLHEVGLAAAESCADPRAQARMLEGLGMAHLNLQNYETARDHYETALRLERQTEHLLGAAAALEGLGITELAADSAGRAIELFGQARDLHAGLGRPRGVALMTRHVGEALSAAGRHSDAVDQLSEALEIFTRLDEPYHRARTLTCLGRVHLLAGRPDAAATALHESLEIARAEGARHEVASILCELSRIAAHEGDDAGRRGYLEEALAIFAELGSPQERVVRELLAPTPPARPDDPADPPP
ncbi:ATP-binding protein [Actinomadura macra]|uniref:ATP-binding protein n=1 Tax=Actinomadura macra TaxID=46164 RepID=UPI0014709898|nr:tetratricopeptide repeat protein [Actinomadura macra]